MPTLIDWLGYSCLHHGYSCVSLWPFTSRAYERSHTLTHVRTHTCCGWRGGQKKQKGEKRNKDGRHMWYDSPGAHTCLHYSVNRLKESEQIKPIHHWWGLLILMLSEIKRRRHCSIPLSLPMSCILSLPLRCIFLLFSHSSPVYSLFSPVFSTFPFLPPSPPAN